MNFSANRTGRGGFTSLVFAFLTALVVAGCGGGNGTPNSTTGTGTTGGGTTTTPVAASLQLLASSLTIPSSGATTVQLTAIVLDSNNNQLTQAVTFQDVDPVTNPSFISNVTAGAASATGSTASTAVLNMGANKTNRNITVTASVIPSAGANPITTSVTIAVTGTAISAPAGGNSLVFGSNLALSTTLTDSAGAPIPGQLLTFHSAAGNTVSPATATTNSAGAVAFTVTGTKSGTDTITVTGAGATSPGLTINVNNSNFGFTSPAANSLISINTNQTVTVHWDTGGAPQANQPIQFTATRGTLSATQVTTDALGNASIAITSPGTGQSTITATAVNSNVAASLSVTFVTSSAGKIALQADSASVLINGFDANGVAQSTNFTPIRAIVRDINNNLVQGATVQFQIVADPSGGSLSAPSAITNISGSTSVNYIAGTTSSGNNTVQISATVSSVNGTPVTGLVQAFVTLTVAGQSLFIRMSTDNLVQSGTGIYIKSYYALVTDAAGNPANPPVQVTFSVSPANVMHNGDTQCDASGTPCPGAYEKGAYTRCTALGFQDGTVANASCPGDKYVKIPPFHDCLNEDVNFNGILDAGEDYNGNGLLTPGNVASVNTSATTDSSGIAIANVTYVKGFATWAAVKLTATITVAGTEFIQSIPFELPILAADVGAGTANIPPPGGVSPFGVNACTSPN